MAHQGYFLVRNKEGHPKFDSWNNIPEGYWEMLTESEKQSIINFRATGELKWQLRTQ